MSGRIVAVACAAAGAALLAGAVPAAKEPSPLRAALRASSEVPSPKGVSFKVGGTFRADYFPATRTLKWRLTFWNLTGKATAAHIHAGAAGVAGPVLIPLCGPCKWGARGTVKLTAAQMQPRRDWYANVHTEQNPGGEIRGQVEILVLPLTGPPTSAPATRCCPPG